MSIINFYFPTIRFFLSSTQFFSTIFIHLEESLILFTHNGTRLLITKVTDEWQGFYQCIARNDYGTGFSNQFQIQILCK